MKFTIILATCFVFSGFFLHSTALCTIALADPHQFELKLMFWSFNAHSISSFVLLQQHFSFDSLQLLPSLILSWFSYPAFPPAADYHSFISSY